jgi:hypothetical protein
VAERFDMNKPPQRPPKVLVDILHRTLNEAFAKQGFASSELVTRWSEIAGAEIAANSEPEKIQWPRRSGAELPQPGTLVLRVEGPAALEIQHLAGVILERVNRFFGWQAVAHLRLRQAPLKRRSPPPHAKRDPDLEARIATSLTGVSDDRLRAALARLGAQVRKADITTPD